MLATEQITVIFWIYKSMSSFTNLPIDSDNRLLKQANDIIHTFVLSLLQNLMIPKFYPIFIICFVRKRLKTQTVC